MPEDCPVCGEPFEYREVREAEDSGGVGTRIEIDDLCDADPETRWNRICPHATVEGGEARLEVFRHHWASVE